MTTLLDTISVLLERSFRGVPRQLEGLTAEQLNRPIDLPETNNLYQLATHLAAAAEFYVLRLVGGQARQQDREADFHSAGTLANVHRRLAPLLADVQQVLARLTEVGLNRPVVPPTEVAANPSSSSSRAPLTVGYCLLHVVHHSTLHVGNLQLTIQLL